MAGHIRARSAVFQEDYQLLIQCPSCSEPGDHVLDHVPSADLSAETSHDAETAEYVELLCPGCGTHFSVTIRAHISGIDAFLTDDPTVAGEVRQPEFVYDDWINEIEPEPHPWAIFDQGMVEWAQLLDDLGDKKSGAAGRNRMLLVQLFSILEAYLSDAIIHLAYENSSVAGAIAAWHPDLSKQQVALSKVATEPHLVRDLVIAQLRKTQFHRFQFINGMLKASIDHYLLPDQKMDRDMVMTSVQIRHDCVHRNGRNADGNIIDKLTVQYLRRLSGQFFDMASHLADKIQEIETERLKALEGDDLDGLPF